MFDIGFWELALIGVVVLLVVGPERLPGLARTAGLWVGRMRRFVASVKADIDREIAADELKKALARQAESTPLHDIIEETRDALSEPVPPSPGDPPEQEKPQAAAAVDTGSNDDKRT
ncbi:MAG TPA: twin-arginine translocase subunit TatB [Gammaproteobacteria bacterium]|nr:twin-arginine translocase subunit TatB [Gammaproteobacteria bacterium]